MHLGKLGSLRSMIHSLHKSANTFLLTTVYFITWKFHLLSVMCVHQMHHSDEHSESLTGATLSPHDTVP